MGRPPEVIDVAATNLQPPTNIFTHEASDELCEQMRKEWPARDAFACTTCQGSPHAEQVKPHRWGCPKCKFFVTSNPSLSFIVRKKG